MAPNLPVLSSKSGSADCFLGFSMPEKWFCGLFSWIFRARKGLPGSKKRFSSGYGNRNYLLNFDFSILVGTFLFIKIRIPPGGILIRASSSGQAVQSILAKVCSLLLPEKEMHQPNRILPTQTNPPPLTIPSPRIKMTPCHFNAKAEETPCPKSVKNTIRINPKR